MEGGQSRHTYKEEMEWWDGTLLDINAACANLGSKCLQLPGEFALQGGCDTTWYPYGKGNKVSALNIILASDFLGLAMC